MKAVRYLVGILLFLGVLFSSVFAATDRSATDNKPTDPVIYIDGRKLELEVSPKLIDGTTFVPMRAILEAQGAEVLWDEKKKTVTAKARRAKLGDITITYKIGENSAKIVENRNEKKIPLTVPGKVVRETTMLPLRFFSEALGNDVGWEGKTQSVTISTTDKQTARVTQIYDGNTIGVFWTNKEEKFRLIGMEAIKGKVSDPYVRTTHKFLADWLEGRYVKIEHYDQQRDEDGNMIGFVYLQDGTFFNATLIAEGYAKTAEQPVVDVWSDFFNYLQEDAVNNKRGLWADRADPSVLEIAKYAG